VTFLSLSNIEDIIAGIEENREPGREKTGI
jgi:hypothetical protein